MNLNEHISGEIINRYAARESAPSEILRVQNHVAACFECREKLALVVNPEKVSAAMRSEFAFEDFADEPEHLPYEQFEFFADGKLDEVEREIAESHFAVCPECAKDLADLQNYRKIAAMPSVLSADPSAQTPTRSFWSRLFDFGAIGTFAPIAAILLVAVLFGVWFFLRSGDQTKEIVLVNSNQEINKNQNILTGNSNAQNESPAANASPELTPSPVETPVSDESIYALNDGRISIDEKGNVKGAENLSAAARDLIRQALRTGKVPATPNNLGGNSGILMSENNVENGVPFALQTPVGKVTRENQPELRWKPLKDATSYEVAIVDDKFRVVERSGKLNATAWKPSKPLPRGANYSWQVTAIKADGSETVSPSAPAPQARFRVIEQNLSDDLSRMEKSANRSSLALGVLYAKAGLRREARAEFEKLVRKNPGSPLARRLLQSVR